MEQRIKLDSTLKNIVSNFESRYEQGQLDFLDEKTLNQLIEYYEKESLIDKALEVVNLALDQYQYRAEYFIIKARLLFREGNIDECIFLLEKAELISPFEKDIMTLKIKALSLVKDFESALTLLEELRAISFADDIIDLYITESYYFENMKQYDLMYKSLKSALKLDPNNIEGLERFWYSVELARKFKDSVKFHKNLIDNNPYNHIAWYNLGLSYSGNWEYEEAIDALEYAFIIDANFESAYVDCADLCVQQGKIDKAIDLYLELNNRFGPDVEYIVNLASCFIKMGDVASAKTQLNNALKLDHYNEEVYFYLGECYAATEDWYEAINAYLKAIELDENREEYFLALAMSYSQVEEYNKATINFHKATQVCREESKYWCEYIRFVLKLGLYDEALQILNEADEHTYGADLLYCRAITQFFLKNKRAGLENLAEALEENFAMHFIIYELAPELEVDKDINAMIKYYHREFAE